MTTLLERIDRALAEVSKTRGDLARHLEVSTQAISGLSRSATATMQPINIAKAAAYLQCDCAWLCGGIDEEYVPNTYAQLSELAREVAELVEQLEDPQKREALSQVYLLWKARPGATRVSQLVKTNYGRGTVKQVEVGGTTKRSKVK